MHIKKSLTTVLLTALGAIIWSNSAQAASYTPGDLFLAFQARGGNGAAVNYVVNIGNASQFTANTDTYVLNLGDVGSDLVSVYGANWKTRGDLYWSVFGTTATGQASPVIYASRPRSDDDPTTPAFPWVGTAESGAQAKVSLIQSFASEYVIANGVAQGKATSGSPFGITQNANGGNSYSSFTIPANTIDFDIGATLQGNFNAGIAGDSQSNSTLDLFLIEPVSGQPAERLGSLRISDRGYLVFVGKNIVTPTPPEFDFTAPVVAVQTPKAGKTSTTNSLFFGGTIKEANLASFTYTVNGVAGPVIVPTLKPGSTDTYTWEGGITLVEGPNTVVFKATDNSNKSGSASRLVYFVAARDDSTPIVAAPSEGSIVGPKGVLNLGYAYSLTAKPPVGKIVKQWIRVDNSTVPPTETPLASAGNSLSFTAEDGISYTAEFQNNFYTTINGTYPGIFGPGLAPVTNAPTVAQITDFKLKNGSASFTLGTTGGVTGTVTINSKILPFKGQFDGLKKAQIVASGLSLNLTLNNDLEGKEFISGTVTADNTTVALPGSYRAKPYTGKGSDTAPLSGKRFSIALQRPNPDLLLGHGFASVAVSKTGIATVSGQLPDGTAFTVTVPVVEKDAIAKKYSLPISRQLAKGNTGLLHGELLIDDAPLVGTVEQTSPTGLGFLRGPATTGLFPNGILKNLEALGSEWTLTTQTLATTNLLTGNVGDLALFSLKLDRSNQVISAATYWGFWPSNNKPAANALPAGTTFTFAPATGAFSGKTTKTVNSKVVPVPYSGLVLPLPVEAASAAAPLHGVGYLLHASSPSASGKVELGESVLTP